MWNPFQRKPLLSEENQAFQFETYKWLLKNFGGDAFYKEAKLILPTESFFPENVNSNEEAALSVFLKVKEYSGMEKWECKLVSQDEDPNLIVQPTVVMRNVEQAPLGTFSTDEHNNAVISYNPSITQNPTEMVATFAHELSHLLTSTAKEPPPGGWDNWEFATDICASFLGFGVFQANSVFNFRQYTGVDYQGWQTTGGGYLSEAEHSYALALFIELKGLSYEDAHEYCDKNIQGYLKKALTELKKSNIVNKLKTVKYVQPNT